MTTPAHSRGFARIAWPAGLALVQAWCLYPVHRTMDLPVWDELNFYALHAKRLVTGVGGLQSIEYGPLYSLLYAPFVAALALPAAIFALRYVLTIGVTLALYALLNRALRAPRASFLIALVWAVSDANLVLGTMAFHLGLVLTMSAAMLSRSSRIAALLCLVLGGFVRPELFLLAGGYGCALVVSYARRWRARSVRSATRPEGLAAGQSERLLGGPKARVVIAAQLALLAFVVTHVSSWRFNAGRSWLAVQQHYAFAQVVNGRYDVDPWADFPYITARDFPGAYSVGDVLRTQPRAIGAHLLGNLASVPAALWRFVEPIAPLRAVVLFGVVVPGALLLAAVLACGSFARVRAELAALRARMGDAPLLGWVAPVTLAPSLLVSLRHPQYMFALMPFAALAVGAVSVAAVRALPRGVAGRVPQALRVFAHVLAPLVAVALLLVAALGPLPQTSLPSSHAIRDKVAALRALVSAAPEVVYGGSLPSYLAYLSHTSRAVYPLNQDGRIDLAADLAREAPGLVAIDRNLLGSPYFDPATLDALSGPEWRCHPGADEVVYVRADLALDPAAQAEGTTVLAPFHWRAWAHYGSTTELDLRRILSVPGSLWLFTTRARRVTLSVRPHAVVLGGPTVLPYSTRVVLNGAATGALEVAAGASVSIELELRAGYNQVWFGSDFPTPNEGFIPAAYTATSSAPILQPLDIVAIDFAP
ncbi:MAG: hypothetical protein R3F49_12720 [Planctomycetota bacterium]